MNSLQLLLQTQDPALYSKLETAIAEITLLQGRYSDNFPLYTDHSIKHTLDVFEIAADILSDGNLSSLNGDEVYILSMACLLHDIGMCIPEEKLDTLMASGELGAYRAAYPNLSREDFIRNIHHHLSSKFIQTEWESLGIPSEEYAAAIALVAEGHRKVDIGNFDIYNPFYFAKTGKKSVCLPFLACILRLADELDITNSRTPRLLTKYYMPNHEVSVREWSKHIVNSQRNYLKDKIIFKVKCTDQNIYAALQEQFEKIQSVLNYCQKVVRSLPSINGKDYSIEYTTININYNYVNFHPKGIRFSFDVNNVVEAFIGEDLYQEKLTALREAIQNSIDSCRYKVHVLGEGYHPKISINVSDDYISIEDNGDGMDELIIENFFARLGSSFYEQDKIKAEFEAIGQFGVGVFSYFLISEYIDIETKTSRSEALKFRFDKDPKNYFHFYKESNRTESGTTITMYLKSELKGKITFQKAKDYLEFVFRHIEIPLFLSSDADEAVIEGKPFQLDVRRIISDSLRVEYRQQETEINAHVEYLNTKDFEGVCGLFINNSYRKVFSQEKNIFEFLDTSTRQTNSSISFSQKGVFVNNYSSPNIQSIFGDINLKKKHKINIDRNGFNNRKFLDDISNIFEIKLLNSVFEQIESEIKSDEERVEISKQFLSNYFENYYVRSDYFKELVEKFIWVEVFDGRKTNQSLEKFLKANNDFFVVMSEAKSKIIFEVYNLPVIVAPEGELYSSVVYNVLSMLECKMILKFHHGSVYWKIMQSKNDQQYLDNINKIRELVRYISVVESDSPKLLLYLESGFDDSSARYYGPSYLNYNHNFIQKIILNYEAIVSNIDYKRRIKSLLSSLMAYNYYSGAEDMVNKMNFVLGLLTDHFGFQAFEEKNLSPFGE